MFATGGIERVGKYASLVHPQSYEPNAGIGSGGFDSGISQRFRQNDIPRLCQHDEEIEQRVLSSRADHKPVALRVGHAWAQPSRPRCHIQRRRPLARDN
jgi:hypothetical protein